MGVWNTFAGKMLMTFLISTTPVLELRGAIPIAMAHGLPLGAAVIAAILGNMFPVAFIILFARKVFFFIRKRIPRLDKLISGLEDRASKKSDIVLRYEFWGLFILVAIPLPGTGAWTGSLVAAMLDMRLKKALPAIGLGVLAAAVIVTFAAMGIGSII